MTLGRKKLKSTLRSAAPVSTGEFCPDPEFQSTTSQYLGSSNQIPIPITSPNQTPIPITSVNYLVSSHPNCRSPGSLTRAKVSGIRTDLNMHKVGNSSLLILDMDVLGRKTQWWVQRSKQSTKLEPQVWIESRRLRWESNRQRGQRTIDIPWDDRTKEVFK